MESFNKVIMGIDVSSDKLDWWIDRHPMKETTPVSNSQAGFNSLARIIDQYHITSVVMEASGGYEHLLTRFLTHRNIPVHLVNPRRIRAFANSKGVLAKTDRIDARIIAAYGAQNDLPVYPVSDPALLKLRELSRLYMQIQTDRTRQSNRNRIHQDPFTQKIQRTLIRIFNQSTDAVMEEMTRVCEDSDRLRSMCHILVQQKGIGLKTAMLLIALLPELGRINGKKIASLAGLAPYANESGRFKGKRYIQGGRFHARKVLYMPVLAAIRFDDEFRTLYESRVSKGKPPKVAIVSLMRKLLVRINARIRDYLRE